MQHGPCRKLEVIPSDKSLPQVAENFEAMIVIRIKVAAQMASQKSNIKEARREGAQSGCVCGGDPELRPETH